VASCSGASCSGASGSEPRHATEPASPSEPTPSGEEDAVPEPDPSSTCGRALACCRAYARAIPDVVEQSACSGVLDAAPTPQAEPRCRAMATGWRQALELLVEAPDACR
jgi:hypothetical protein